MLLNKAAAQGERGAADKGHRGNEEVDNGHSSGMMGRGADRPLTVYRLRTRTRDAGPWARGTAPA
jgi:hypothetical protein